MISRSTHRTTRHTASAPSAHGVPDSLSPPGRHGWDPTTFRAAWQRRRDEYALAAALVDGAKLCDLVIADIERAIDVADARELTLTDAAAESGYSVNHLRRLVRAGSLANVGSPRRPRVRSVDLPRKAAPLRRTDAAAEIPQSKGQIARSIVNSGQQGTR